MKAISPVIATVIIVAVAIAISIAVALWITGMTSSFTGLEKLEIVNAYATYDSDSKQWNVILIVKNTGTKTATIDQIFINNKPGILTNAQTSTDGQTYNDLTTNTISLDPGKQIYIKIYLNSENTDETANTYHPPIITDTTFSSGQTVSIVIHTASGGQYPATVTLP